MQTIRKINQEQLYFINSFNNLPWYKNECNADRREKKKQYDSKINKKKYINKINKFICSFVVCNGEYLNNVSIFISM